MSYVMANIKLPLLVKPDGDVMPLIDHISIDIERCDELPEKVDTNDAELSFMEQIKNILSITDDPSAISIKTAIQDNPANPYEISPTGNIMIFPEEILGTIRPPSQNITLKNYRNTAKHRNTVKRR